MALDDTKNKHIISKHIISSIQTELVDPSYYSDIESAIKHRNTWRKCGHICETLSKKQLTVNRRLLWIQMQDN